MDDESLLMLHLLLLHLEKERLWHGLSAEARPTAVRENLIGCLRLSARRAPSCARNDCFPVPVACIHSRYMRMKTAVQRWGNSLAVRIPRAFAQQTRLGSGTEVDLELKSGTLVISPVRKRRYKFGPC